MDVVIAGGHGKIGRRLARLLVARGDRVRGLIRNPDHSEDLRADGSEPVLCDLEPADVSSVAEAVSGADAVVFAAGAGPGSGAERKLTMDRDGAIKLLSAAQQAGVPRYVIVSSVGAESPPDGDDVFSVYLRAKAEADQALMDSDRDWTVVRPGMLTDEPGT
ncbi:MAG TPA: SDR family oxidoreductase, partial [Thermoleophilaceae bacterium]|nr:SDR family oxidoreductase [Thermoleophilaceae bacterium]